MWTAAFWKDSAERAIKTFAQTAVGVFAAGATPALDVDWQATLLAALLAAVASLLSSVGSAKTGSKGTAQLGVSEPTSYGY